MADIVLINPRFEVSFWGMDYALPLLRKRAAMPVASLALLAALTPDDHQVTIVDENVEQIDFKRLAHADIVGITGMSVQRFRMREILIECQNLGIFTAVGGPWASVNEEYFEGLTDVIFVGEAEQTWPLFLHDWSQGCEKVMYKQAEPTDMTTVPVPRWDLLKMRHYFFGSVQFSRGCPFQCDFCDIAVTFGRRPRFKTSKQMIAELDALHAQKKEIVFIVDDNLVSNKIIIKDLLRNLIAWQQKHGFPIIFAAEASLDIAEDEELMQLMVSANIQSVFIGIESPNELSLLESKKFQNIPLRKETLLERIYRVQNTGLAVWSGMIIGFDSDEKSIFTAQLNFLQKSRIAIAMIGMLFAIPKTSLYHRLLDEDRLDTTENMDFGTNMIPLKMTRKELREGYLSLMHDIYKAEAFFKRLDDFYLHKDIEFAISRVQYWRHHFWARIKGQAVNFLRSAFLFWQLMRFVPDPELRKEYRRGLVRYFKFRRDPSFLFGYLITCTMHYHFSTMTKNIIHGKIPLVNSY